MKSASKSRLILASQVRKHRKAQNKTQEDMANATGLSSNYLSALENGRENISVDNVDKIAQALSVPTAALFIEGS